MTSPSPYEILAWYILAQSVPRMMAEEKRLREEIDSLKDQLRTVRYFRPIVHGDGDIWITREIV